MNQDTTRPDDMAATLRRVQKLLAMAQDSRGDPNECAAASRMAESIMRKYQIDHSDLIVADLSKAASFAFEDVNPTVDPERSTSTQTCTWAGILSLPIAALHGCIAIYARKWIDGKGSVMVLRYQGYAPDALACRWTHHYVTSMMAASVLQFCRANAPTKAGINAYRMGYISAVAAQLREAKRRADEEQRELEKASTGTALMVVKARAVAEHFGKQKERASRTTTRDGNAYAQGRADGSRLDVGRRAVTGSSTRSAGLLS